MRPLIPLSALAAVVVALGVAVKLEQTYATASDTSQIDVSGVQYETQGGRMLDENGDAPVIRALPQSERLATRGEVLYGVFITLANNGPRTRPMSRRFALMDDDQHSFRQIPLRRDSPYAYRAGDLAAGRISPADGSAPAENLAEQGYPLVFRVPRGDASDGLLVLRVFDPTGATAPQDIIVQAL